MKIAIIGYGFVGKGMARLFQNRHEIAIYDPRTHPHIGAISGADMTLICVPTPMSETGAADVSAVEDAVRRAMGAGSGLIVIKSTVPPGTTDRLNAEHETDRIHFSPEYMGEGRNFVAPWLYPDPTDSRSHTFCICGGVHARQVLDVFQSVMALDARYIATTPKLAELAKYMENSFLATKVTFCNEFARIADAFGCEYGDLRELWLLDSRNSRSHTAVFKDAPGYGGKCLPKDIAAISSAARGVGVEPMLLDAVQRANEVYRK